MVGFEVGLLVVDEVGWSVGLVVGFDVGPRPLVIRVGAFVGIFVGSSHSAVLLALTRGAGHQS